MGEGWITIDEEALETDEDLQYWVDASLAFHAQGSGENNISAHALAIVSIPSTGGARQAPLARGESWSRLTESNRRPTHYERVQWTTVADA